MPASLLLMLAAGAAPERCALQAWSVDADPAGLNVRAGPSLSAPIIGRLPPAVDNQDASYTPNFDIVDARDGWVKIARADDLDNPGKPRPVFKGQGWVHHSRVTFTIQTEVGRAAPGLGAPVVVRAEDLAFSSKEANQPILACSGGWVKMGYALPAAAKVLKGPRSGVAWFGAVCGNQHTTCDGVDERGTKPPR